MFAEITHETIKGTSQRSHDMGPGQAMILRVKKNFHHEKNTDYGNVLVLVNVIQRLRGTNFRNYQNMIIHLAMFSHPNPKKNVLIIGDSDVGLRAVIKHHCLEAIPCGADEAVPMASKKYLPNMAAGFNCLNMKIHIGDGFEILAINYEK
ncbi:Spermine/spermidine synthase-domain-containing protein [Kalaharituber pfeilii]|nr:Spermine/spermidine synthase-domain-containing protein [Kalaharituber pfeilii]